MNDETHRAGRVRWMLFCAIAFRSGVHERSYDYGETEERLAKL